MQRRIVIIDDDDGSRFLYRHHLGRVAGLEIIAEFENAEEALLQIPQLKPDVVVVDYVLPGMSGVEFAVRLNQYPEIKVLLATGHDPEYFDSEPKPPGNVAIVRKGWSKQDLERLIAFCR